ncbi:phage minor capsid protein [Oceanobacillus sp. FSL K6-0251]|uniref:phage minor capsid protein n=1 Tax=Oceanobacillus sp. FSL K6-0251 TaxID=2921602 RepID=UPI0030F6EE3D
MNEEQLLKYVREISTNILGRIAIADLTKEKGAEKLLGEIGHILDQYSLQVDEVLPEAVLNHYFGGVDEATKALKDIGSKPKPISRVIHQNAVEEIMDDTLIDMQAAIRTAKASAISTVTNATESVQGDIAKGLITGEPRKVIQQHVAKSFEAEGLTAFITSDGKKLPLDFYAMTVTRSKMRHASVQGNVQRYKENEQDLVQIIENDDSCAVCANHNRLVVSLTGETEGFPTIDEIELPPYHPNCRGTISPYAIDFKSSKEVEQAIARNDEYEEGEDPRTEEQKKAYEKEQEARRRANEEKKQYARWKGVMGDDAPKNLGAFRSMKRQDTVKFQELQSEYRSISQQIGGGG